VVLKRGGEVAGCLGGRREKVNGGWFPLGITIRIYIQCFWGPWLLHLGELLCLDAVMFNYWTSRSGQMNVNTIHAQTK
jgi:hypothetical protein